MTQAEKPILEQMKGRDLSAVTFVRDYLQLQFDGPFLNIFVWPRVTTSATSVSVDMPGYRDALCGQIGKSVGGVVEEAGVRFCIFFTDGSIVDVSLLPEDRMGPETLVFQDGKGGFRVW
jgi:hypothetical protein